MSAGWVAGTVRSRSLLTRRIGAAEARRMAAGPELNTALGLLAATSYGRDLRRGSSLADAERAVSSALLWNLRVLAGWQPPAGVTLLRAFAADFEIANTEDHLRYLAGSPVAAPFRLGALATVWPRVAAATTAAGVRAVLTASAWGDPGAETAAAIVTGMRLAGLERLSRIHEAAAHWAAGSAALLVAREVHVAGRPLSAPLARRAATLLGPQAVRASSWADFVRTLAPPARWAVVDVAAPDDLWRAEARRWTRLGDDGFGLIRRSGFDAGPLLGTAAVLTADAWRVRAALECAVRGGTPLEAFDALA
jgi:hypothetical protein